MTETTMITQQPAMKMTTPIPENRTTPDTVKTSIGALEFFDGVPVGDTEDTLVDFVERGRAVEAFINMTPATSMYSLRRGHRDLGLTECNQILIAEQLGDSEPLVLTWNNTSLYTWGSFWTSPRTAPRSSTSRPTCWAFSTTCTSAT